MKITLFLLVVSLTVGISQATRATVFIDDYVTNPLDIDLVEGRKTNPVTFEAVASSTDDSGTVPSGLNFWTVSFWGSKKPNGQGPQSNPQTQVLDQYQTSTPLLNPGDNIDMSSVFADFDMTGLKCADVPYLCSEFNRDPKSSPQFEMEAVPDDSVLRHCFPVPDDACKGVIATDLDFDMEFTKIVPGEPDNVSFDIDVSTLYTSAGADGNNLWRVGFFTSSDAVGSETFNYYPQILTLSQSSIDLRPGEALKLPNVNTEIDLTGLGCVESLKYVCLEFAKGLSADPDFKFQVSGGGRTLIKCEEQECETPIVVITGVNVVPYGPVTVTEGTANNMILFSVTGITDKDLSGEVIGVDLWDLETWGSTNEDCSGTRYNNKIQNTLQQSQKDMDVYEGQDIALAAIDMEFDMTGANCQQVQYFCSHLKKNPDAAPNFGFQTMPDESVAIASFAINCMGN